MMVGFWFSCCVIFCLLFLMFCFIHIGAELHQQIIHIPLFCLKSLF